MSDLRQASNGKWKIVGIKHDQPGISIPAEYTYNGSKKTFNITTSEKTIATDWETPLGEAIKLADITRTYTDVVDGNKIYRVKLPENFTIHPAGTPDPDPTISLKVSPTTTIPSTGGTIRYTATTTPADTEIEVKCSNNLSIIKTTKTGSFSVPANSSESQITYRVSAYCADNPSIIATGSVKQEAYVPPVEGTISVTPTSLDFDYLSGKQKTFTVNTTGVASVKLASGGTNGSKFSFTPLTGTNGTVFIVETKETNLSDQDYTGIVVVSDNDGVATAREITVNQKYEPIMQQFASTTFPATGGNILFTVHTDYDVVFRSVPDWITISLNGTTYAEGQRISSGVANNQTFTLTAAANTGDTRTVQATFNMGHYIGNELQNRVRYFNFTQGAAEPDVPTVVSTEMFVTPGELKLADNGNAQLQVIFRTNYSDGTSYDEDITSGAGVSYAVAGNTSLIDLTSMGEVTVKSNFTGDSTAYIVVSYPGHGVEPVRVDVTVYSYFIRIPSPYATTSWVLNPSGGTSRFVVNSERVSKVNGETISEDFPVQYAYNGGNESQKYTDFSKSGDTVYYITFSYPESTSSELDEYGRFEIKVVATDSELGVTRTGRFALKYYEPVSAYWGTSGVETTHMFSSVASQYQAKIFATSYWSASTISPWLSISPETGRGNSTIIVTCEENTKNIFRSGSISIIGVDNSCSSRTTLHADQYKSGDEQPDYEDDTIACDVNLSNYDEYGHDYSNSMTVNFELLSLNGYSQQTGFTWAHDTVMPFDLGIRYRDEGTPLTLRIGSNIPCDVKVTYGVQQQPITRTILESGSMEFNFNFEHSASFEIDINVIQKNA